MNKKRWLAAAASLSAGLCGSALFAGELEKLADQRGVLEETSGSAGRILTEGQARLLETLHERLLSLEDRKAEALKSLQKQESEVKKEIGRIRDEHANGCFRSIRFRYHRICLHLDLTGMDEQIIEGISKGTPVYANSEIGRHTLDFAGNPAFIKKVHELKDLRDRVSSIEESIKEVKREIADLKQPSSLPDPASK